VVVHWKGLRRGVPRCSGTPGAPDALHAAARMLLEGRPPADAGQDVLHLAWESQHGHPAAIVARPAAGMAPDVASAWLALAREVVDARLAERGARVRIESLEKSERLQQALYEIADLSGSDLEMGEMLARIHAVVGGLMYAENFYIVLYDDARDTMRFLYFADRLDTYEANPDEELHGSDMPNSLTLAILRHGEPAQGSSDEVREHLGVQRDSLHGPESQDWLGVPMRRDDRGR